MSPASAAILLLIGGSVWAAAPTVEPHRATIRASRLAAGAAEYFVDCVNGLDSNSGLSAPEAWRTIGRAALASVGTDVVVHVAPGVCPAEPQAIELGSYMTIVGSGIATTTIATSLD